MVPYDQSIQSLSIEKSQIIFMRKSKAITDAAKTQENDKITVKKLLLYLKIPLNDFTDIILSFSR